MLQRLKKRISVFRHQFTLKLRKNWNSYPIEKKRVLFFIGNHTLNATLLAFIVIYFMFFEVFWFRMAGLIPAITIFLVYFEHYYKWLRIEYKEH